MGWVLASNVAFLGPQFGVSLLGWKFACFFLSIGDPPYSMADWVAWLDYGLLFLALWTICFHRLLSLILCAAAVASTRGGISATGHCHALKMA
jgi:hypothetical protein